MSLRLCLCGIVCGWVFVAASSARAELMHFVGKHEATMRTPEGEVRASGEFEARTLVAGEMEVIFSKLPAADEVGVDPAAAHVTVLPLGALRFHSEEDAFLGRGAVTFLQGEAKRRFQVRMVLRLRDIDGQTVLEGAYEAPGGPGQPPVLAGTLSGKRDAGLEEADLARLEAMLARQEEATLRAQLEAERRRREVEAERDEWERRHRAEEYERWRNDRWRDWGHRGRDRDKDRDRDHDRDRDDDRDRGDRPGKDKPPTEEPPQIGPRLPLTATPPAE